MLCGAHLEAVHVWYAARLAHVRRVNVKARSFAVLATNHLECVAVENQNTPQTSVNGGQSFDRREPTGHPGNRASFHSPFGTTKQLIAPRPVR